MTSTDPIEELPARAIAAVRYAVERAKRNDPNLDRINIRTIIQTAHDAVRAYMRDQK